jgi:hypothetical protein
MKILLVIDEHGAAALVPGQLAKLLPGHRIIYLSDTRHAPYRTLSRATVSTLALRWLDLFREDPPSAVLVASATMARTALGTIRLGCKRIGAHVYTSAELSAREIIRAHRFGMITILGSALLDEITLGREIAKVGLDTRVIHIPTDVAWAGKPSEEWLRAVVDENRETTGTYVISSGALRWCRDEIRRTDPDAVVVEADSAIAIEIACELEARGLSQEPSKATYYITEWSEYWQSRVAELAGVAADAVFGRSPMSTGPTSGPFAITVDEDGDPIV